MTPEPRTDVPADDEPGTAYEKCPSCDGSAMQLNSYSGEPDWCRDCGGNGVVRARDERGRFMAIPANAEPGMTQYAVRTAIRDLRRIIGFERTREYVAGVLLDEGGARTIEHERH